MRQHSHKAVIFSQMRSLFIRVRQLTRRQTSLTHIGSRHLKGLLRRHQATRHNRVNTHNIRLFNRVNRLHLHTDGNNIHLNRNTQRLIRRPITLFRYTLRHNGHTKRQPVNRTRYVRPNIRVQRSHTNSNHTYTHRQHHTILHRHNSVIIRPIHNILPHISHDHNILVRNISTLLLRHRLFTNFNRLHKGVLVHLTIQVRLTNLRHLLRIIRRVTNNNISIVRNTKRLIRHILHNIRSTRRNTNNVTRISLRTKRLHTTIIRHSSRHIQRSFNLYTHLTRRIKHLTSNIGQINSFQNRHSIKLFNQVSNNRNLIRHKTNITRLLLSNFRLISNINRVISSITLHTFRTTNNFSHYLLRFLYRNINRTKGRDNISLLISHNHAHVNSFQHSHIRLFISMMHSQQSITFADSNTS